MVPVQNTSGPSSVGDFSRSKVRATLPTVASPSFSDKRPHDDGHLGESVLRRADERTRTADLISLRVCGQWLPSVAEVAIPHRQRGSCTLPCPLSQGVACGLGAN